PLCEAARKEAKDRLLARAAKSRSIAGLAFANDEQVFFRGLSEELTAQGVLFLPLAEALKSHSALVEKHFMTHPTTLGGAKFEALHRAHCRAGAFLYVPKGVELPAPVEVHHWIAEGGAAIFPHTLVVAEANAKAEIVIHYGSLAHAGTAHGNHGTGGFSAASVDLHAGPGAKVRSISVQNFADGVHSYQTGSTAVEKDGAALSFALNLGGSYARVENKSRMLGAGSRSDMLSLTAATGTQVFDQRTYQEHVADHTTSDLLYKNALADTAKTVFAGMIAVDPGAQQTDAYQSNPNLLLSETAEANSLPGLQIEANDVRCTHGSTGGPIRGEEVFYMAQRGIPLPVARRLFVLGFFDEVLERLGDAALSEELHALIEAKYDAAGKAAR
ncbi:MAG TPA: Fe-S cluster assembly protein SufD, partial [Candidatus Methylacidiphilales bacterium]